MTTIESIKQPLDATTSPYMLGIDDSRTKALLSNVLENIVPYADSTTNPDLGSLSIYMFDGNQEGSDLARIVEANVLSDDPEWGQPPEQTESEASSIEENSRFFVLIDQTTEGPEIAGSLRVADCENGPSETESFFRASFGDVDLPGALKMENGRAGVWDIVYVVLRPEYRNNGVCSSWLYFAMHKNSVEEGKREWISNISDSEYRNLSRIGIPFTPIEGAEKVSIQSQSNPEKVQNFGFYHTMLDTVADSVDATAAKYESRPKNGVSAMLGRVALISRFGSFTRPEASEARLAS